MPKKSYIRRAVLVAALSLAALPWCGVDAAWAQASDAKNLPEPEVAAEAWAVTDLRSGEYLAGKDASEKRPMASTTKIMAAIVVLEEGNLDEEATVSRDAASFAVPAYSNVGLYPDDVLSVRELLMASMISSGDDAAYALAEHVGGGSADRFVAMMNEKAEEMGLEDTRFDNPIGLDGRNHHTTARDLATMTRAAMEMPAFREIVSTRYASVTTLYREIPLTNTNDLLFAYPPATGVKTGTTPGAGESLVSSAAFEDESYAFVILDAKEDRFAASLRVLENAFAAHDRVDLVAEGRRYAAAEVPYRRGETIELRAAEDVEALVDASPDVERRVRLMEDPPASARPGTRLGEIVVTLDGEKVGESALVAGRGYGEASLWERAWYTASSAWK